MDALVTYQQNTFTAESQNPKTGNSNAENQSINTQQTNASTQNNSEKKYTPQQIRNWRQKQEAKMFMDSTNTVVPRTAPGVTETITETPSIVLPVRKISSFSTDWLTVLIFFAFVLFATVRYAYGKYMEHLFLSLFNYATSVRMFQERNYPVFHGAFRLEAIFYLTFSIFVFQTINALKWQNTQFNPVYFLMVLGVVLVYFFSKKLIYLLLGSLFEAHSETREYLFNIDNFNRSLGLILLIIVVSISYTPFKNPVFIVYVGIFIIAVFNLLLLKRGISILLKKQFSIFYLFLYLCTLEFLPLLLIYKVVVE
jgi:hypothetical protein